MAQEIYLINKKIMSYRNPKISQQDPLAFTKGFQAAFGQTMSAFKQVSDEIKKQQEKDDILQAELLKFQNIGSLENTSKEVNAAIQESIESLINPMAFSFMKPVARQKHLQEVADIKTGLGLLTKFMAIAPSDLSVRSMKNNKDLHAILHQLSSEERAKDVVISGDKDSLDVIFTYTDPESGRVSKVSARDMNKYANTYVSVKEDLAVLDKVTADVARSFNPIISAYAQSKKYINQNPREVLFNQESTDARIKEFLTPEIAATIFEEELAEQTRYQDYDPKSEIHKEMVFNYFKNEIKNKTVDIENLKEKEDEETPPEEKSFLQIYRPQIEKILEKSKSLAGGKAGKEQQQDYVIKQLQTLFGSGFDIFKDGGMGTVRITGKGITDTSKFDSEFKFNLGNADSILQAILNFKGPDDPEKRINILDSLNL